MPDPKNAISSLKVVQNTSDLSGARAEEALGVIGFPEDHHVPFLRACRKLESAGYGSQVTDAYKTAAQDCAPLVGPSAAIDLADCVSVVTIKCGRDCARTLCEAAVKSARLVKSPPLFLAWVALIQRMATLAKESVSLVLARNDRLLSDLGVSGLESWAASGLRASGGDAKRRLAFFSLKDPEAVRLLQQEAGEISFANVANHMRRYLISLYGVSVPFIEAPVNLPAERRRRASFGTGYLQLPVTYPGYRGAQAEDIFRAAVAHAGAHYRYSKRRFFPGDLKPVQLALVSLIEDARVEALAIREFPGLLRLWLPFHIAQASGALTAPSLFARLSRALIDPDFSEIDGWVRKGRDLFNAHHDQLEDPAISRHIGNILGNDLGQMRVQFNAKTYVVEPPYRDDNAGIWDFEKDRLNSDIELEQDSYRINSVENDAPNARAEKAEQDDAVGMATPFDQAPEETRQHLASYPEYDYSIGKERPDWVDVFAYDVEPGDSALAAHVMVRRQADANKIASLVKSAHISRAHRLRRQPEGEALDLDACIEAAITLRMGNMPEPNVYKLMQRRDRDLAVHLLLDASQSTLDRVPGHSETILDMERDATVMLSSAMAGMKDPFAVSAFSSNGRQDVRFFSVKPFNQPFDGKAKSRLFGLKSGFSTRLGAALRHGAAELEKTLSYRRLLMLMTDGEPSDIDCPDRHYLVEDARRAVQAVSHKGINVVCIALGKADDDVLERIFGRQNLLKIADISQLPARLPLIYFLMTR